MTLSFQTEVEKEIHEIIKNAWHRTIRDYKNAEVQNAIWNEATLRLNFLRRLSKVCEINHIALGRILSETKIHCRKVNYKPDLILDVKVKNKTYRIGFEMKYFDKIENWKRDLQKLENYLSRFWDFRYFIAIGENEQCIEIEKALSDNKVKILTQIMPRKKYFSFDDYLGSIIEKIFGKEIDYITSDQPIAWVYYKLLNKEDTQYIFRFLVDEDKLVVYLEIPDISKEKLEKLGQDYEIDKENDLFKICEFLFSEYTKTYHAHVVANKLKEPINKFIQKLDILIEKKD